MAQGSRIAGDVQPQVHLKTGWKTHEQQIVLVCLFRDVPCIANSGMFLSGGTCLSAFYLGHRNSEDLDLFVATPQLPLGGGKRLLSAIASVFGELEERQNFDVTNDNECFLSLNLMGIKVDFVSDIFAFQHERPMVNFCGTQVCIDSWENLCVSKFAVFLSRGANKDILDIGAILARVQMELSSPNRFVEFSDWLIQETQKREYLSNEVPYIYDACIQASERLKQFNQSHECDAMLSFSEVVRDLDDEIQNYLEKDTIGPER